MSRQDTIKDLADRLRRMERRAAPAAGREPSIGTGHAALDSVLPAGGLRQGTLLEWINGEGPGSGAATLALLAAGGLIRQQESGPAGTLAVVDRDGGFYAAAAAGLGLSPERILLVQAGSEDEWKWAVEQVLRSSAVDVVLTWADSLDDRVFRRWQLAAELGGGVGMLVRSAEVVREASWASVRLMVRGCVGEESATGRRWSVRVLSGGVGRGAWRAGYQERDVLLELNDETGGLRLLPRLERAVPPGVSATG
jgi:protein ImuA